MKKMFLSLMLGLMAVITACNSGGGDPKTAAKNFFEALKTMNIDEAAKYATKESKIFLDLMKTGVNRSPKNIDLLKAEFGKHKVEYSEAAINGDQATITVTVDGKDKTDFRLKKEEGQWKVAFDLSTLMKTGMEKMEEKGASEAEMKEAGEALKQLDSGSLKDVLQGGR
jgi:hypothetical protein